MSNVVVDDEQFNIADGEEAVDLNEEQLDEVVTEEAPTESEQAALNVPEKFRDKSLEDVIASYSELEKE